MSEIFNVYCDKSGGCYGLKTVESYRSLGICTVISGNTGYGAETCLSANEYLVP